MPNDLKSLRRQINHFKRRLSELWDIKGKTDQEILDLSKKIDILLNKYYLLKYPVYFKKWRL